MSIGGVTVNTREHSHEEVKEMVSRASSNDLHSLHAYSVGANLEELQKILDTLSGHLKTKYSLSYFM